MNKSYMTSELSNSRTFSDLGQWSSHHGAEEMNPARNHGVAGASPGLAHCGKGVGGRWV